MSDRVNGDHKSVDYTRRKLLAMGLTSGSVALASALLKAKTMASQKEKQGAGSLVAKTDPATGLALLNIDARFSYRTLLWSGDTQTDGSLCPDLPDGMAAFSGPGQQHVTLIRNHERALIPKGINPARIGVVGTPRYDGFSMPARYEGMGGGTTAITVSEGKLLASQGTLAGTMVNCAGGPTPWGSWLSCEEIMLRGTKVGAKDHGYVFEVPVPGRGVASAKPIVDMGFMKHEAAAVLQKDGSVYLTEDNGAGSGFYRFLPKNTAPVIGALEAGGHLQMLKVSGLSQQQLVNVQQGQSFDAEWVTVEQPDADPEHLIVPWSGFPSILGHGLSGPCLQGSKKGAALFGRLEGCWAHDDSIYFTDTIGGPVNKGIVWLYQPRWPGGKKVSAFHNKGRLLALFVSESEQQADNIDNITLHNNGLMVLCEDGGGRKGRKGQLTGGARLLVMSPDGELFPLAENTMELTRPPEGRPWIASGDYRGKEFAGACFDPAGEYLYVNGQVTGVLFAITGPWHRLLNPLS